MSRELYSGGDPYDFLERLVEARDCYYSVEDLKKKDPLLYAAFAGEEDGIDDATLIIRGRESAPRKNFVPKKKPAKEKALLWKKEEPVSEVHSNGRRYDDKYPEFSRREIIEKPDIKRLERQMKDSAGFFPSKDPYKK